MTVTRKRNTKGFSDIEKIDKDHYVVKSTGEIKEYAHVEKSQEMIASNRRKSMNKKFSYLRQYINMNFKGEECERQINSYLCRADRRYGEIVKIDLQENFR